MKRNGAVFEFEINNVRAYVLAHSEVLAILCKFTQKANILQNKAKTLAQYSFISIYLGCIQLFFCVPFS